MENVIETVSIKSCETCGKKDVCKHVVNREVVESELDRFVNSVSDTVIGNTPFVVSMTCSSHILNIAQRKL